jgi:hypothetical protein
MDSNPRRIASARRVVGALERRLSQKLASRKPERKRTKSAVPLGPPKRKYFDTTYFYMYCRHMAKTNQKIKLQKRDWLIVLLLIAVIATNWVWYQNSRTQGMTNKSDVTSWSQHQVEINKLQACVNNNTRPCDITPPQQ